MTTANTHARDPLFAALEAECARPVSPAAQALCDNLRDRHGDAVQAIIFYGSCLRSGTDVDGILDIFVIVDSYAGVYPRRSLALANRLLPPNVFYLEMDHDGRTLRTKYAIITLDQFVQRTSPACFHTFFWARFAQPCALTYARDASAHARVVAALGTAVRTFVSRILPLMPARFDVAALWATGLSASYRTELRPERPGAARRLVEHDLARYENLTSLLAGDVAGLSRDPDDDGLYRADFPAGRRWRARQSWRVRRVQGKLINLARIMKAAYTFDGGVDYVLWKIERHSGVRVEASPMLRRHPLLACWPTVWRLYRAGAFR